MSTKYKISAEVPTAVLAKRLDELSDVVGQPGEERDVDQQKIGAASFRHEIMESVQAPFRPHIQGVFEVWLRRQAEGADE